MMVALLGRGLVRRVGMLCLPLAFSLFAASAQADVYDVLIVAGQSNANGHTLKPPPTDPIDQQISFYFHQMKEISYDSAGWVNLATPQCPGHATQACFGSEIYAARALYVAGNYANNGRKLAVFKWSDGGENMVDGWRPWEPYSSYYLYGRMVRRWNGGDEDPGAYLLLKNAGHTVNVIGMIWMQGESDAPSDRAAAYEERVSMLLRNARDRDTLGPKSKRLGFARDNSAPFPIAMGRINREDTAGSGTTAEKRTASYNAPGDQMHVRNAIVELASTMPNLSFVDIDDAGLRTDNLHMDDAGQRLLGERAGRALSVAAGGGELGNAVKIGHTMNYVYPDMKVTSANYPVSYNDFADDMTQPWVSDGTILNGVDASAASQYLMYTADQIDRRWGSAINTNNTKHVVAVHFSGGKWYVNTNGDVATAFLPRASDVLIATISPGSCALITTKQSFNGIAAGIQGTHNLACQAGDTGNPFRLVAADSATPAFFLSYDLMTTGHNLYDPYGNDGASVTGISQSGYILYSAQGIHHRFPTTAAHYNQHRNLVAVTHDAGGNWTYYLNGVAAPFLPDSDDVLIASFSGSSCQMLKTGTQQPALHGVQYGYRDDMGLTATPCTISGGNAMINDSRAKGSGFVSWKAKDLYDAGNSGVTAKDTASGSGYIMYSEQAVQTRFGITTTQHDHLVAVQYDGSTWKYFNNESTASFTPVASDLLIAAVDYSVTNARCYMLAGVAGEDHGIPKGYVKDSGLNCLPNIYGGVANTGEFTVTDTTNRLASFASWRKIGLFDADDYGVRGPENLTATTTYVMYSEEDVHARFSAIPANQHDHLVMIRYYENAWYYYQDDTRVLFTPRHTDVIVAEVDYPNSQCNMQIGMDQTLRGIRRGYKTDTGLSCRIHQYQGVANQGEVQIVGTTTSGAGITLR